MQVYETRVLLSDAMNDSDFPTSRRGYILSGVNKPSGAEPITLVSIQFFLESRQVGHSLISVCWYGSMYFGVDWSTEYCGFVDYMDSELCVNLLLLNYSWLLFLTIL